MGNLVTGQETGRSLLPGFRGCASTRNRMRSLARDTVIFVRPEPNSRIATLSSFRSKIHAAIPVNEKSSDFSIECEPDSVLSSDRERSRISNRKYDTEGTAALRKQYLRKSRKRQDCFPEKSRTVRNLPFRWNLFVRYFSVCRIHGAGKRKVEGKLKRARVAWPNRKIVIAWKRARERGGERGRVGDR